MIAFYEDFQEFGWPELVQLPTSITFGANLKAFCLNTPQQSNAIDLTNWILRNDSLEDLKVLHAPLKASQIKFFLLNLTSLTDFSMSLTSEWLTPDGYSMVDHSLQELRAVLGDIEVCNITN